MEFHDKITSHEKAGWKTRFAKEITEYLINVIYLAIFFGVFAWYRRFVLAEYQIDYFDYGASLVEALVLAKVVMIGDIMRLGRRLKCKPLLLTTLYKSLVFAIFVAIFTIVEYALRGIFSGKGFAAAIAENRNDLISRNILIFFAFIPFFAFKELERILGEKKIKQLFLGKTT
ncbi:MAG TPA: hypothetical protein VK254_04015 [Candidatus Bathyarchaeia archaeon]|nr:hypothetical protein [Candidatus Bathyarchaeia archaeon]